MDLNEYQNLAKRTRALYQEGPDAVAPSAGDKAITIMALGLTGESGELADHVKKYIGHGHPFDRDYVAKELGDILWYVANLADVLGIPLDDIGTANIEKLIARYPDGFSTADSLERRDTAHPLT